MSLIEKARHKLAEAMGMIKGAGTGDEQAEHAERADLRQSGEPGTYPATSVKHAFGAP